MALSTTAALALLATAGGAGLNAYNTNRTLSRQDASTAQGIREQSRIQQKADAQVAEQVKKLEGSRSADERAQRMGDYMKALVTARRKTEGGLQNPALGGAFNEAGAAAARDLATKGTTRADLMAGVDAPGMQRQGEAFDFGRLATDLSLIGRESEGQRFISDLRTRSIRRNPWIDVASSVLSGLGSGMAGAGSGAAAGGVKAMGNVDPYKANAMKALFGGGGL